MASETPGAILGHPAFGASTVSHPEDRPEYICEIEMIDGGADFRPVGLGDGMGWCPGADALRKGDGGRGKGSVAGEVCVVAGWCNRNRGLAPGG
jgi:hypothetical protein